MTLAVPLLEVEQGVLSLLAGEPAGGNELAPAFSRARHFLDGSRRLLEEVGATLLSDALGEQKLRLAEQELEHSLSCLDRLEAGCSGGHPLLLADRLKAFVTSARSCSTLFGELSVLGAKAPIFTPSAPFDVFIKAGLRHLEGGLERASLEARLHELRRELSRYQRLVGLLPRLHAIDSSDLAQLQQSLSRLQTGFGALELWRTAADRDALLDGLKLLGSATTSLVRKLDELEPQLGANPRYSRFRPLEEWLRLRHLLTVEPELVADVSPLWVEASVADFFRSWDYLLARAGELEQGAHTLAVPGHAAQRELRERWSLRLGERPPTSWTSFPEADWLLLAGPLEDLQRAIEEGHRAQQSSLASFRHLPGLERLALLKGQARRGEASPLLFEAELRQQLTRLEELISSSAASRDPISAEIRELLPVHRSGFLGMLETLERGDWEALEAIWQGVMTTLPHLISLSQGIARRLAQQGQASLRIACLRCGHSNAPERRICASCGANLPAVVARAQSVAEFGHDHGDAVAAPALDGMSAVDLLEELVRGVEANRVTRRQTGAAVDALLADLEKTRKTFASKVIPLMGQDPTVDLYLRFFAQAIGAYTGALKNIRLFAEGGSLAQLHSYLAECREMLHLLEELKSRIDDSLRG